MRYLKMRLAGDETLSNLPVGGIANKNGDRVARALSSWFLATIILRAQAWLYRHEAERLHGRTIQWSANVGVPVEYCDSPLIDVFREVLAVAWTWSKSNAFPQRFHEVLSRYPETVDSIDLHSTDCHAVPEIAAAVHSFVTSRDASPGIYIYFDIGGGTLDGAAFRFTNLFGERRINFYAGKVAPLGLAAIGARLDEARAALIEQALSDNTLTEALCKELMSSGKEIQRLVAGFSRHIRISST
jgi:hypothetical protein